MNKKKIKEILIFSLIFCTILGLRLTQAQVTTGASGVASVTPLDVTSDLTLGSRGSDVILLQTWLMNNGYDIPSVSSGRNGKGYFGNETKIALQNFQRANSLPSNGFFGPLTRAKIKTWRGGTGGGGSGGGITYTSLTVLVPNDGESWQKGITQNITWADQYAGNFVDISLMPQVPACAEDTAPVRCMIAVQAPYVIAKSINSYNRSYPWSVGWVLPTQYSYPVSNNTLAPDGLYKIRICTTDQTRCDTSDNYFSIFSNGSGGTITNSVPVINGVDAPTTLSLNQTGVWTVRSYDPNNGALSYSVDWGDTGACANPYSCVAASNMSSVFLQNSSFTHIYSVAGTYTIRFTVRNNYGLTAQSTITVQVGGNSYGAGPLSIISPNGGESWRIGSLQAIRWTSPYYIRATYADLKLIPVQPVCQYGYACPMLARAPYQIAVSVPINQNSYNWVVGNAIPYTDYAGYDAVTNGTIAPAGQYSVQICETNTSNCDTGDAAFTIY